MSIERIDLSDKINVCECSNCHVKPYLELAYDWERVTCPVCGANTEYVGDYYDEGFMDGAEAIGQWNRWMESE